MAMLQSGIPFSAYTGVKAASTRMRTACSKKSFDKLIKEIKTLNSTSVPGVIMKDISDAFDTALESVNADDRLYFLNKLARCSSWTKYYSMIHRNKFHEAFSIYNPNPMMDYITIRHSRNLLERKDTAEFLKFYKEAYKLKCIHRETLVQFIKTCMGTKDNVSLAKFFEIYILYTGSEESIKEEALHIDNALMESMIDFFGEMKQVKSYSKCVSYYITRLKRIPRSTSKVDELRLKSKLMKFNMYVDRLGPVAVLKNDMFHNFRLLESKKIRFQQLEHFIDQLSDDLKDKNITLGEIMTLIDYMHGLKTQRCRTAFTKALNPDIQMERIYKFIIDKSVGKPNPKLVEHYNLLQEMSKNREKTHMRDHIPKKLTKNQILSHTSTTCTYKAMSLQIILRVLNNLQKEALNADNEDKLVYIAGIAADIFRSMVQEHSIQPHQSCFEDLYEIFNSTDALRLQIPSIKSIEFHFYSSASLLNTQATSVPDDV